MYFSAMRFGIVTSTEHGRSAPMIRRPVYDIYFEIINTECTDEANACDWESVYDYKENGDYIEGDVVAVLMELVCREYSERA